MAGNGKQLVILSAACFNKSEILETAHSRFCGAK
jgi:hypothetical protein